MSKYPIEFDAKIWEQGNSLIVTIKKEVKNKFQLREGDILRLRAFVVSCDKCGKHIEGPCDCDKARGIVEKKIIDPDEMDEWYASLGIQKEEEMEKKKDCLGKKYRELDACEHCFIALTCETKYNEVAETKKYYFTGPTTQQPTAKKQERS